MKGLRVLAETVVGLIVVVALLFAVDHVHHPRPARADASGICPVELSRAPMLCDRVRGDVECGICAENHGCLSSTHVYCVTANCDDASCTTRRP